MNDDIRVASINYQGNVISSQVSRELESLMIIRAEDKLFIGNEPPPDEDAVIYGLPTLVSVCKAVVLKLLALDNSEFGKDIINNDHWAQFRGHEVIKGNTFPSHAIINVRRKDEAEEVAEYLNKMFAADRAKFPSAGGWKAVVTHGGSTPSLSDDDHPFFYYKKNEVMNSRAARILVVVDLATEGLNNKYVSVWGCGTPTISVIDANQRLGRTVRTAAVRDHMRGTVAVPPSSHDNLYVITHEDYVGALQNIVAAFQFVKNSSSIISDAMTIGDYVNDDGDDISDTDDDISVSLSVWERFAIARKIGHAMSSGTRPALSRIVKSVIAKKSKKIKKARMKYANAWAESAYAGAPVDCHLGFTKEGASIDWEADALSDLRSWLRKTPSAALPNVLAGESIQFNAMDYDECVEWLNAQPVWGPVYAASHTNTPRNDFVSATNVLKVATCGSVLKAKIETKVTPKDVIDRMIADLNDKLDQDTTEYVHECVINRFSTVRPNVCIDNFAVDGPLCDPAVTYEMRDEAFQTTVRDYTVFKLLECGKLTDIAAVLRV